MDMAIRMDQGAEEIALLLSQFRVCSGGAAVGLQGWLV